MLHEREARSAQSVKRKNRNSISSQSLDGSSSASAPSPSRVQVSAPTPALPPPQYVCHNPLLARRVIPEATCRDEQADLALLLEPDGVSHPGLQRPARPPARKDLSTEYHGGPRGSGASSGVRSNLPPRYTSKRVRNCWVSPRESVTSR